MNATVVPGSTVSTPGSTSEPSGSAWSVAWPPLIFGLVFVLLWEAVVKGFDLKPYFLPAPSTVLDSFVRQLRQRVAGHDGCRVRTR